MNFNKVSLYRFFLLFLIFFNSSLLAQHIPAIYSNLSYGEDGSLYLNVNDTLMIKASANETWLTLNNLQGNPQGSEEGIRFNFNNPVFKGSMYYGLIPYGDSRHPQPVFFNRNAKIDSGKTFVGIKKRLAGKYDMVGWESSKKGTLGYRVVDANGRFLYEGRVSFKGAGPFEIDDTIIEGPIVNLLNEEGATISFNTNNVLPALIEVDGKTFSDASETQKHEIKLDGLKPNTCYKYTVRFGHNQQTYEFKTAPEPGSRKSFTFAYASDSRSGQGGGERDMYGANFYMMKKIVALNSYRNAAFMVFTGDLINGYLNNVGQIELQYANWKRAVEPFTHYTPILVAMGNHEAFIHRFRKDKIRISVDQFPFETHSAEAIFAANFVNPLNGPESEDGSVFDPDKNTVNFPSYKENVFSNTYDNVAIISLNSDYWYAPSLKYHTFTSGNLHAYIMDNQVDWLKNKIDEFENNNKIDHIFIAEHTPFFPNGGHIGDDMWYGGNNKHRAWIAGMPVKKGIIERRDELLDLIVNKSKKVRAILTGDEHNYCRTEVGPLTNIYPEEYAPKKIKLERTIWQINNGAAGAPYYAQESTPWTDKVKGFTTQNAVVYLHVDGKNIEVEVQNPDTLEPVDRFILTQ